MLRVAMTFGVIVLAGLATANAFEKTYDPLRKLRVEQMSPADPENGAQIREGAALYAEYCAACHGGALEGAENWQDHNEDGTYKPPPHDDSGHTWHHSDKVLFEYVKLGGEQTTDLLSCCATMAGACAGFMAFLPTTTAGEPLTGIVASYPILKFRLSGIDPDSDFRPPRA